MLRNILSSRFNSLKIAGLIIMMSTLFGCKKFVMTDAPPNQLLSTNVYTDNATANAAQLNIFQKIAATSFGYSLYMGYSADEFNNFSTSTPFVNYYLNTLTSSSINTSSEFWNPSYSEIYQCNAVLEGIANSSGVSTGVKNQLIGEAKFCRAFIYFYLLNQYGDVPLILQTDYADNQKMPRSSKAAVLQQVILDLSDAQTKLNNNFVGSDGITTSTERLRPTVAAANALLARAYLYSGDYAKAEVAASSVIASSQFSLVSDLTKVFLKNSTEAIWQVSIGSANNSGEGQRFIATSTPSYVSLSSSLLNSFESGDKRRIVGNWVNSVSIGSNTYYFPFKYRVVTTATPQSEYTMVLRLAEQYLIRAEARVQQNINLSGAIADINTIRTRAGLSGLSASLSQAQILSAIEQERRVELFSEWGDRWLNLKRTGRIDAVMTAAVASKGTTWNTNWQWYPIPQTEIALNSNLTQNAGY